MKRRVTQEALPGVDVELIKSYESIDAPGGATLTAVRKRPVDEARATVVLVHGLGQNRYTFHLRKLSLTTWLVSRGYDTWNLELRGHGRSRPHSPQPRSADDYIQLDFPAAIRSIADRVDGRVFAVGHSLGGAVLFGGVPYVRHLLAGVIGVAPVYRFGSRQPLFRALGRLLTSFPRSRFVDLRPLPVAITGELIARILPLIEHDAMKLSPVTLWEPRSLSKPLLQERVRKGFDSLTVGVLRQLLEWASTREFRSYEGRVDYSDRWRRLGDVPLLVVAGSRDKLLPPSDAKVGYRESPSHDRQFRVFDEADGGQHWGHVDLLLGKRAPDHVWREIDAWIGERLERR